jgi:hypothetical protein
MVHSKLKYKHFPMVFFVNYAYLTGLYIHLWHIQIWCCKINHAHYTRVINYLFLHPVKYSTPWKIFQITIVYLVRRDMYFRSHISFLCDEPCLRKPINGSSWTKIKFAILFITFIKNHYFRNRNMLTYGQIWYSQYVLMHFMHKMCTEYMYHKASAKN